MLVPERNFSSQGRGCRYAIGERRPGKMEQRQTQRQQPSRWLPPPAARAQQGHRCRQQDDPVADFHGHAQGQGIWPQQDSGSGKAYQNGRDYQ